MERYILFRSRGIHTMRSWDSHRTHRGRGSDFSDIWLYIPGDDTRDISWRHSARTWSISKKIRIDEETFSIYIIQDEESMSTFYTPKDPISTYEYTERLESIISTSAKKYHYSVHTISIEEARYKKNSMIFYITSDVEWRDIQKLWGIAAHNDLIVLHVFHPYEIEPTDELLFWWVWVNKSAYQQEFEERRKSVEKNIHTMNSWYLLLSTSMPVVTRMNQFFRHRYL